MHLNHKHKHITNHYFEQLISRVSFMIIYFLDIFLAKLESYISKNHLSKTFFDIIFCICLKIFRALAKTYIFVQNKNVVL